MHYEYDADSVAEFPVPQSPANNNLYHGLVSHLLLYYSSEGNQLPPLWIDGLETGF